MTVRAMLHDLKNGHGAVMEEGVSYNAQCDGKNHYLYKIDKRAINPKTGRPYSKGRVYAGKFDRSKSPAYCDQWASKHVCGHGGNGSASGRIEKDNSGRVSDTSAEVVVQWVVPSSNIRS